MNYSENNNENEQPPEGHQKLNPLHKPIPGSRSEHE
jgi:hypothetical protein